MEEKGPAVVEAMMTVRVPKKEMLRLPRRRRRRRPRRGRRK
jgi:hypothetical protein